MTPVNGKFEVIGFAAAAASVSIPTGTTHITLAGANQSTHVHAKVINGASTLEFIIQPGIPFGIVGTELSNSTLSGGTGNWTHVTFLKLSPR